MFSEHEYINYIPEVFEAVTKTEVKSSLLEADFCLPGRFDALLELRAVVPLVFVISGSLLFRAVKTELNVRVKQKTPYPKLLTQTKTLI